MTVLEDFKSAPWPIKLFLLCAVAYMFIFVPLVATGYFGEGLQRGLLAFFGVRT